MKFARYLEETQTPEWKRAYINYRGLKKRITAIRKAQEGTVSPVEEVEESGALPGRSNAADHADQPFASTSTSTTPVPFPGSGRNIASRSPRTVSQSSRETGSSDASRTPKRPARPTHQQSQSRIFTRRMSSVGPRRPTLPNIPLKDLLPMLSPVELQFFEMLDAELEKIESFYLDREKEAKARSAALKEQLQELKDHRKLFYEAHPVQGPASALYNNAQRLRQAVNQTIPELSLKWSVTRTRSGEGKEKEKDREDKSAGEGSDSEKTLEPQPEEEPRKSHSNGNGHGEMRHLDAVRRNPEEYQHAKKKLKRAVQEHYRGLEVLNNYRILNLTGFRKALKKFEKITRIPAQQAYMEEKVEPSAFASSGKTVDAMMREMEELFAARFERGDKKKALERLRTGSRQKSHHFSTFRSGVAIGLAIHALISGLYLSFQREVREDIVGWDALLFVYGIFLIPVVFALLVGLNLLVWSRARVNYVFIFELEIRSRLDYREYFEVPAILFCTLCYAFWLSFSRIGSGNLSPTVYPAIWLLFATLTLFDPLPFLFKKSRWWLIRNVSRLLTSGTHRVEFTDFWLGDQFCSLVWTLSNLYFVVCVYAKGYDDAWGRCASPRNWAMPFVLASLPLFVRLVQSVKRWYDSRLITHLINGGKYGFGIVMYGMYYNWRYHGSARSGASFALYCLAATIYSSYASAWDFLMDWSVLRLPPRTRYPLLREELLYSNHIPMYYIAIITNVMIRFIWILYLPARGPNFVVRTFIGATLEMLRRWQWNFYRLENEHLGNMDQYRVTREVPLPYSFDDEPAQDEGDEGEDGDEDAIPARSWRNWKGRTSTSIRSQGTQS